MADRTVGSIWVWSLASGDDLEADTRCQHPGLAVEKLQEVLTCEADFLDPFNWASDEANLFMDSAFDTGAA